MLQATQPSQTPARLHQGIDKGALVEAFNALTGLLRRRFPIFIVVTCCTLGIGVAYLATTTPVYTATATMVIDTNKAQEYQHQTQAAEVTIDAGTVQTQVEILKSANIAAAVVRNLHLADDPEFIEGRAGLVSTILKPFRHGGAIRPLLSDAEAAQRAAGFFDANCTVARVGQTYAMAIQFQSADPGKAARIANAVVDAYVNDQLDSKLQATRRASLWLQDRIGELRTQAAAADRAMVDFKGSNNMVDADGKLMNEQQLSELNSQLVMARAATAEAKARLDRISEVMKQPVPDAALTDAMKSEIIVRLRQKYLELSGLESIYSARYGANHEAVVNLRTQMTEIKRNIGDEMQKIAESYKSDYTIAQARETALQTSLSSSVSDAKSTDQAKVQLRELQSNAQSYRSLYDSFLQRSMDAAQQQSFSISEARIISPAIRPGAPSKPVAGSVIGAALMGGLLLSFGIAVFREMLDGVFRSGSQVESRLQLECLATVPLVRRPAAKPVAPAAGQRTGSRSFAPAPGLWRHAVDQPFSTFTEALRSIKIAVDLAGAGRSSTVLGITSTLPGEGKSTIAANFAALIAHAGSRVLLVDADLRNPSLSRALAPQAESGLVDVIQGRRKTGEVIWTDNTSNLAFLPAGAAPKLMHTNEILGSEAVRSFCTAARAHYDYIIVDLAPLAPVVDTRATVHFIDAYLYAVEWGVTKIDVVEDVLANAREIGDNVLGIVLNKADAKILGRYERHRGDHYHRKFYKSYGYTT